MIPILVGSIPISPLVGHYIIGWFYPYISTKGWFHPYLGHVLSLYELVGVPIHGFYRLGSPSNVGWRRRQEHCGFASLEELDPPTAEQLAKCQVCHRWWG